MEQLCEEGNTTFWASEMMHQNWGTKRNDTELLPGLDSTYSRDASVDAVINVHICRLSQAKITSKLNSRYEYGKLSGSTGQKHPFLTFDHLYMS